MFVIAWLCILRGISRFQGASIRKCYQMPSDCERSLFNANCAFVVSLFTRTKTAPLYIRSTGSVEYLECYKCSSLKQRCVDGNAAPLGHIIPIPNQPVFSLLCCVLSGEAVNTNFIVFSLFWPGRKLTIYRIQCDLVNHYTSDVLWPSDHIWLIPFDLLYLTPLSAIVQLYHGDQF